MKRIFVRLFAIITVIAMLLAFASCGESDCEKHVDESANGYCDYCGTKMSDTCEGHYDDNANHKCD